MANNSLGTLQIGNTSLVMGSDGIIYDNNFNPLGKWIVNPSVPHFPGTETVSLIDNSGALWANIKYDTNTGTFTAVNADNNFSTPVSWSANPNAPNLTTLPNTPVTPPSATPPNSGIDTQSPIWTTINTVGPNGQPYSYGLGADMTTLYDQNGNAIGKYTWDGANGFSFFNLDNSALGSFDASTGTFTSPDGQTATGSWSGFGKTIPMNAPITQTSQGTQTGTTQSGIDWSSPVAAALQGQIISSAQALPGLAEQAGVQAQDYYTNLMGRAMGQQGFQGVLNKMNQKGMLGSSLTEGALARAQQAAGQAIADKAFAASLAGTQAQMQVPGQLGNLTSQLGGTTGTTTSSNWLQNITNDPLRPYNTWGTFLNIG